MNCEAAALAAAARRDVEAAGGIAFRERALCSLRLKTVVKEPHGGHVAALAFNYADEEWRIHLEEEEDGELQDEEERERRRLSPDAADVSTTTMPTATTTTTTTTTTNLVASAGGDHVVVYDDRHMGDYVAVVVAHSADAPTPAPGAAAPASAAPAPPPPPPPPPAFSACAWVSARGWTPHPHGDAVLAAGGASGVVSIISVAEAAVVAELDSREAAAEEEDEDEDEEEDEAERAAAAAAASQPPPPAPLTPILGLSSASGRPGLLLVLGGGGRADEDADEAAAATLWHVPSGRRLALFGAPTAATAATAATPRPHHRQQHQLTCAALHPEARSVVAGDARGRLWAWPVPTSAALAEEQGATARPPRPVLVPGAAALDITPPLPPPPPQASSATSASATASLDCLKFLPLPARRWALAAKASDGRVVVLEWRQQLPPSALEGGWQGSGNDHGDGRAPFPDPAVSPLQPPLPIISSWQLPTPRSSSSSSFGATPDGRYLATAVSSSAPPNRKGPSHHPTSPPVVLHLYVHDARTGRLVSRVEPDARLRLPGGGAGGGGSGRRGAPRAVALSPDGRHAYVAPGAAGLLLRYEAWRGPGCSRGGAEKAAAPTAGDLVATAATTIGPSRKRGRGRPAAAAGGKEAAPASPPSSADASDEL
jgi:hypothetical protein